MVSDMDGFKQINDRFGHLEGNRVLRLFAQALKDTCREYDYVARMGGDEFVVDCTGLSADAAGKKAEQMRALARQAGSEVCGEDILSLSVGRAMYPEDGKDAEQLLAEADRRMYLEKQKQLSYKDRRSHPRMKCRVTIEMQTEAGGPPMFANVTDVSLGGVTSRPARSSRRAAASKWDSPWMMPACRPKGWWPGSIRAPALPFSSAR